MNPAKVFSFITLPLALLHLLLGCSNVGNGDGPDIPGETSAKQVHVIYEANPRVFASEESLNAISGRMEEIKALGTDIIWLMPIFEQGKLNAIGSPYCVKDYKKVNPQYGTLEDLKSLVALAHSKDMKVILDWVANHTSWDNAWIENKDWYTQNTAGDIISPAGMGWDDVADLNYNNVSMRAAMLEAMEYWVKEADVDGYRCDYAEGVPHDFWQNAVTSLRKLKGDSLIMLAETSSNAYYSDGFDMAYSWNLPYTLEKVFKGTASMSDIASESKSDLSGVPADKWRMRYITNHDMMSSESLTSAWGSSDGAIAAFVVTAMLSDCVMIYSSQEIGWPDKVNFFVDNVMDWNSNPDCLKAYKDFMQTWLDTRGLRSGTPVIYAVENAAAIWWNVSGGNGLFTVVNTTGSARTVKMPIERVGDRMSNVVTGESVTILSTMELAPYQYLILKK